MLARLTFALSALALLSACAGRPVYPDEAGEARGGGFTVPKPTYPVVAPPAPPPEPLFPPRVETAAPPPTPPPASSAFDPDAAPAPYTPVPIRGSQPVLRERRASVEPTRYDPPPATPTPKPTRTVVKHTVTLKKRSYTVEEGDTLYALGRRFSIGPHDLADLNDLDHDAHLKPGQKLTLPPLKVERDVRVTVPSPDAVTKPATYVRPAAAPVVAPRLSPAPPAGGSDTPAPTAAVSEGEAAPTSTIIAGAKGRFAWPLKGDILSAYGPKGPGQRNDGVNIAANAGDPVRASADGEVVYAGNSVPGFGNLVVVKHPGGWTSLYGNLGKMSVKIRAAVSQGQTLGLAGVSGPVDRPQVHFELRYAPSAEVKARPVDPAALLP